MFVFASLLVFFDVPLLCVMLWLFLFCSKDFPPTPKAHVDFVCLMCSLCFCVLFVRVCVWFACCLCVVVCLFFVFVFVVACFVLLLFVFLFVLFVCVCFLLLCWFLLLCLYVYFLCACCVWLLFFCAEDFPPTKKRMLILLCVCVFACVLFFFCLCVLCDVFRCMLLVLIGLLVSVCFVVVCVLSWFLFACVCVFVCCAVLFCCGCFCCR